MAGPGLPTNIDSTYADSGTDASVKLHQQYHDAIHGIVNGFDTANATTSGFVPVGNGTVLVTRALLSTDNPGIVVNSQSGTAYTLVAADAGKMVETNNASANTWTVPSGVFSAGHVAMGRQYGAGLTSIIAGSGMTLLSRGSLFASAGRYAEWTVTFRSASEAVVTGDLA